MYSLKTKLHERQKKHIPGNLRTIALDVTSVCNMKCQKCYAETFVKFQPIDISILKNTLRELYEMGVFHYVLQGGEAILEMERLENIIKSIYPNETYINVVSNGWNMSLENIRYLKSLQVDKITFSLDSGIKEEHDSERMKGSYDKVLEAIDNVLSEGLLSSISIVLTHESLYSDGFKKAYEFAIKKQIRVDAQIAMPVGKWDAREDILITEEDAKYIKQLQIQSPRLGNGLKMINRDIYSGDFDHCPAGTEFMSITASGEVLPCNFIQCTLGNIKDKSFRAMRNDLLNSKWFDGKHTNCICGEDKEYMRSFIKPYVNLEKPLDAYKVFNLNEGE